MKTAIISGTFDPVTVGHIDIITRAACLFDKAVVAVSASHYKSALFSEKTRVEAIKAALTGFGNIEVEVCKGLLADFCAKYEFPVIVRGARNCGDFEYECGMAAINREITYTVNRGPHALQTVILPADPALAHISSSYVRELIKYGKSFNHAVPAGAYEVIKKALEGKK